MRSFVTSQVFTAVIALMKEAANFSEISAEFYQTTWRKHSEDSHLHSGCFR
jgi:hypothetical protein